MSFIARISRSLDERLRLLALIEGQIVGRANCLASIAGAFPATEGLIAGPRTGGRALRTVRIRNPGFDVIKEPVELRRVAIEPGGESERCVVRELHSGVEVWHARDHRNRQEHLLLPKWVGRRRLGKRWCAEEAVSQRAVGKRLTAT